MVEIITIHCPQAWIGWVEIRHISPRAIRLDDWPSSTYAGNRGIYGHPVNRLPSIEDNNQGWKGYAPYLR